jgi:DNA-binding beta-propeller fold protein YncE
MILMLIPQISHAADYKGPSALIASADGATLYVLNQDANEIALVSTTERAVTKAFPVPNHPNGMALSPDGKTLAVTCGDDYGVVVLVNAADGKEIAKAKTGHFPCAPVFTPDGKRLFVCNRFNATVFEYDTANLAAKPKEYKAVREPISAAITPDGKTLFVANFLPNDRADSFDVACEVTTIDTDSGEVNHIRLPNGTIGQRDICVSPDGKYVYSVAILGRYPLPTTQIERGWINTNALNIIDVQTKSWVNTVLLDDVDLGAANPWAITTSADGSLLYIAIAGSHELCIVRTQPMFEKLLKLPETIEEAKALGTYDTRGTYSSSIRANVQNDLAFLVGMKTRVRNLPGRAHRSVAAIGTDVYLGAYFSDTLDVVDTAAPGRPRVSSIPLGPEPEMTPARRGMLAWHDAKHCMQQWMSCASCHPDARADGLNWDLLNDGMGNPKNAKSMIYAQELPPAMWRGVRADAHLAIRTGFRFIQFAVPDEEVSKDIEAMFAELRPLNSPYLVDGKLSEAAERGKILFNSERIGCYKCHPESNYFSDGKLHDVNSNGPLDREVDIQKWGGNFDTPTLIETWRTAPYLHDGRYVEMRELFMDGLHGDGVGRVKGMTEQEVDDLSEYVLSL